MKFNESYIKYKELAKDELSEIDNIISNLICVRKELGNSLSEFLISPSKRIRPLLALLYLKSLGEEISENHLKLLSALEIIHNASLIHDDIIDDSDIRRGEKTISNAFGTKLGVISGDYLLSVAMKLLCDLNSVKILQKFSETLEKMCIGEINQKFDLFKIGTIENYIDKSKNKTAYLFETGLVCSILLCNKDYDIEKAAEFGINFGIAFQIRDDLLNITQADNSKPYGNDVAEGIYNAPVIYSGGINDLTSGIEKTRDLLNNYIVRALKSLENIPQNYYKTVLKELTELMYNV